MKGTDGFKKAIETYLQTLAENDSLFAKTFIKENKNIDDCITYILTEVKKSGQQGYAEDEVYAMAVHYYDEDSIVIAPLEGSARVVVNQHIPYVKPEITHSQIYKPKTANKVQPVSQISLF